MSFSTKKSGYSFFGYAVYSAGIPLTPFITDVNIFWFFRFIMQKKIFIIRVIPIKISGSTAESAYVIICGSKCIFPLTNSCSGLIFLSLQKNAGQILKNRN